MGDVRMMCYALLIAIYFRPSSWIPTLLRFKPKLRPKPKQEAQNDTRAAVVVPLDASAGGGRSSKRRRGSTGPGAEAGEPPGAVKDDEDEAQFMVPLGRRNHCYFLSTPPLPLRIPLLAQDNIGKLFFDGVNPLEEKRVDYHHLGVDERCSYQF